MIGCESPQDEKKAFELIPPSKSGVNFRNDLTYSERLNTYTYRNFYNGAGVAVGDINNDGLVDIYFCGNQVDNKLYLNKGNFQFEDITEKAGVACKDVWSTGVSMADVNNDGLLDLYICKAGPKGGENRHNELFINNGDLTFSERSKQYGIADEGLSIHAAFFDYDKDGDLDFYLLNNSLRSVGRYDLRKDQRMETDSLGGNKLYRNDGEYFTNVSSQAGIYTSFIGFGLGVTISDLDRDGWQDIFVSNDFFEKDYLYLNQGDGTFKESLESVISETSMGSMGADIADINNDGYPEIYITEMLPEREERYKTKTLFEDWDKYQSNLENGYYEQFTRNAFQLNNGPNGTTPISFSEISRITDLHATDWSWGALIFDYNNDGLKDIFVANGIGKDLTDLDYVKFYSNNREFIAKYKKDSLVLTKMIDAIPSVPLPNFLFENQGGLNFKNRSQTLGLADSTFSNGAVYGDLDNDGDLDLVVNNINGPGFVYRNNSDSTRAHFLMLTLTTTNGTTAVGAQVEVYLGDTVLYQEVTPIKGYLSSVDHRVHFGLGAATTADSLVIQWPNEAITVRKNVPANSFQSYVQPSNEPEKNDPIRLGAQLLSEVPAMLNYTHEENDFTDFNRDRLLFEMHSNEGPRVAQGDVNGDGLPDIYLAGAKDQAGELHLGTPNGGYKQMVSTPFDEDAQCEDTDALFFDSDNDGDLDLYVTSGGNEFGMGSNWLKDRLYINDGNGRFSLSTSLLPNLRESSSFVASIDFDNDQDMDLVVGTRLRPFLYGVPPTSYLLENDGAGKFKSRPDLAPGLTDIGMITDGSVADLDGDGDQDMILVGKWTGVHVIQNDSGTFENSREIKHSKGLWNTVEVADINGDGRPDIVAGNLGENTRYRASPDQPLRMYINDFDRNGSVEQITCQFEGSEAYPIHMLDDLTKQLPSLRKRFSKAADFKSKTIEEIFSPEELERAVVREVQTLSSMAFINQGGGEFSGTKLTTEAQFAPIYAIEILDLNGDQRQDLLVAGNFTRSKPEWGIYKASFGQVLLGESGGAFQSLSHAESGFFIKGEIRDMLHLRNEKKILIIRNNSFVSAFKYE